MEHGYDRRLDNCHFHRRRRGPQAFRGDALAGWSVCPHCGVVDEATELQGKTTRAGLYKCKACQKPFTATIGTLYERSHIPLHKWLLATHLLASSQEGY